jgi:ATP-dependent Lon protease
MPADSPAPAEIHDAPIPEDVPAFVLATTVVFPFDVVSVQVGKARDVRLLDANPGDNVIVGCFFPRAAGGDEADDVTSLDDVFPVGVACRVIHRMKMPNDTMQVVFQGLRRIERGETTGSEPYLRCRVTPVEPKEPRGPEIDGLIYRCMEMVDELVRGEGSYPREMVEILRMNIAGGGRFADLIGAHVNLPLPVKRRVASTADVRDRLRAIEEVLQEAIGRVRVEADVTHRVKVDLDARQREGLLRAQMRAIRKELGEESGDEEVEDLRERVRAAGLPTEAEEAAKRELERMAGMSSSSAEYHVARTYIGWILDLPWHVTSKARFDLEKARAVLDRDHSGLEDVKDRILEFLAVRKLKKDPKGPLLCLIGPPGVGKTSLGRSVAEAVGRPFVRISVGGMRDEAEIKGHRRTYVGALPGKIIQALKRAGSRDPVFMVDEIDKMGSDAMRGDPSSAMLEVLDPEQNATFSDHYLDVPFDLSRVFFIATGNILDDIPGPLRDRMEVISLAGYTREEKFHIARRHLWPKVVADNGLKDSHVEVTDDGIRAVIEGYTREAGVRSLERLLGGIARKVARAVASFPSEKSEKSEKPAKVIVAAADVERYLDAPTYQDEGKAREPLPGVATGLAWTAGGGTVMFIETQSMPGTGRIHLTGRLGDVMKESAELAMSWVRANAEDLGIEEGCFSKQDVHVHVPEGAVPKDGPSAGVTLVTALVSLFTDKPIRTDLAMTGEVTLKGRVLPVGGVKEKVLSAHRAGIRHVLLPEGNRRDLKDIPAEVREQMTIDFTADVRQNLASALMTVLVPDARKRREIERRPTPGPTASPPP